MATDAQQITIEAQEDIFIRRLLSGERNPYLVYELCKRWKPTSFGDVNNRLPYGIDRKMAFEGWEEYAGTRR